MDSDSPGLWYDGACSGAGPAEPTKETVMKEHPNRIVIKVGTSSLTSETGRNDLKQFDHLARVISDLHNKDYEIILVSSGAIAIGSNKIGLAEKPKELPMKQAAAAIGQSRLMFLYDKFFSDYDKTIAQILLNAEDIKQQEKKDNLTNTFHTLLSMGIIPVVNENDSVSYTEIQSEDRLFGDNDMLSAVVASLCNASHLIILSDIDGFYDKDPRKFDDAALIERVDVIDEDMFLMAGGAGSRRGTGGMQTKLQAASFATERGIDTHVINGRKPEQIYQAVAYEKIGTFFPASPKKTGN